MELNQTGPQCVRFLGQEMGYEISVSQMQHDAADKKA